MMRHEHHNWRAGALLCGSPQNEFLASDPGHELELEKAGSCSVALGFARSFRVRFSQDRSVPGASVSR